MLQEIHIAGHAKKTLANLLARRPGEFDVITITNHDHPFPEWVKDKAKECLHLVFDDITYLPSGNRHILPSREHVRTALEWAKDRPAVVVACHAGVSRSSATAYLIACQAWGPGPALSVLSPSIHRPNVLVVRHGAEVLGDEEVWERFREWHNKSCGQEDEVHWEDDLQTDQEEIEL
jgi:predicted protein tyrosine phosphatase